MRNPLNLPATRRGAAALMLVGLCGCVAMPPEPPRVPPVPPLRAEAPPPRPLETAVWQPGEWMWNGRVYEWVPGRWIERPVHRARWVRAHWAWEPRGWVFVPGHWQP